MSIAKYREGSWYYTDKYLCFEAGLYMYEPYKIDLSEIQNQDQAEIWTRHLQEKKWFTKKVYSDFAYCLAHYFESIKIK